MEWRDHGIVLWSRRHGERAYVVDVLCRDHGRHSGLIRESKRLGGALQPGTDVELDWKARLENHLGRWRIEQARVRAAACLDDAARLSALASATAVTAALLPEREPHPNIHAALTILLDSVEADDHWAPLYVRYELGLLTDLGFGLDLAACALTGTQDDLAYVSPKTGRAVNRAAAGAWADKLLRLPEFLLGRQGAPIGPDDISAGLALCGHFLERHIAPTIWARAADARNRLTGRLQGL